LRDPFAAGYNNKRDPALAPPPDRGYLQGPEDFWPSSLRL